MTQVGLRFYLKNTKMVRDRQQLIFILINGAEEVEVISRKRVTKSCAKIFYIVITTTFKRYFCNININLKLY